MSLIEQAAKRLDELRKAGIHPPSDEADDVSRRVEPKLPLMAAGQGSPESPNKVMKLADRHRPCDIEFDFDRLGAAGIVTPGAPRSQIADEFRVIKRPLLANACGKGAAAIHHGNLIMVTSAVPGEGKSFTAANLAMSIAMELDHTVLLVDADVARPSLPTLFGIPAANGLLDVLIKPELDLGQVLQRTNVEKLSLLQSGTQHPRATELLASDAMANLLDEIATRYADRIVVFDSPPQLVTTEARVLASRMGQVVFVVQAERTLQGEVHQALAAIENCPVKLMVLNKAKSATADGYGYGYGYGYGA